VRPSDDGRVVRYNACKYRVFRRMTEDQLTYRAMMASPDAAGESTKSSLTEP
jgi:hypothetical protein